MVARLQATEIYEPIQERLARVVENVGNVGNLRFPFLAQLLGHVFESPGKRVRPAITLLASSFSPHDSAKTEIMATAVELLHVATLIHDDTVDESETRRGKATLSTLWGRNVAVLAGDYVFAASATFVCDTEDIRVIRRFSETIMELSTGELQEIAEAYNLDQTRESYVERIYNKTASLFTTAGESGAILSGASEEVVFGLTEYSRSLGLAFQIVDDILDFEGTEEEVGKPVGSDLSSGILTLPAIIAMERFPDHDAIRALFEEPDDDQRLRRAVEMIQGSGAIDDANAVAQQFGASSLESLKALPESPSRDSLEDLVRYVLRRRV